MIAHIVLFRPKADLSPADRRAFVSTLERTCREVPTVTRAIVGRARPTEAATPPTYPYAAVIEFDDEAGFRSYLAHPIHAALRELFWRSCEATIIADIEATDARGATGAAWLADATA